MEIEAKQSEQPGLPIVQARSRKTYEALIATGFELLQSREFDSITIAELARTAGYSVGAFYARFKSKDEYFDVLTAYHLRDRAHFYREGLASVSDDRLIDELIGGVVRYYWRQRYFWRAALFRGTRDPKFWVPIRASMHENVGAVINRIESAIGRRLSETEETNVRFAFQLVFGTINNTILNRPGPLFMDQLEFVEKLARAFRLVVDMDKLMDTGRR